MPDSALPPVPHRTEDDNLAHLQARIDHAQRLYREWTQLLPRLQAAQADWQRGADIMQALADFYFNGDYMRAFTALEQGVHFQLETPGEHSVMAEDTLWNAFHEQQTLAWQRLRSAISVLDRQDSTTSSNSSSAPAKPQTLVQDAPSAPTPNTCGNTGAIPEQERSEDLDGDLAKLPPPQLLAEARKLRAAIRRHRDSTGHDLCWYHPHLWALLPEQAHRLPQVPDWPQFMRGCVAYRASLDTQCPQAPRISHEFTPETDSR